VLSLPVLRRQLAASDEPLEALLDRAHAAAERRLRDIAQPHRIARGGEGLGDPRPIVPAPTTRLFLTPSNIV
jgi:hypothetical protein